jgi:hypothetical protein
MRFSQALLLGTYSTEAKDDDSKTQHERENPAAAAV